MPATVEDLDIAEVLAERHKATPIWNDLMAEYDADAVDDLGRNWPPLMTTTFDEPASGDEPNPGKPGQDQPEAEPAAEPDQPTPQAEPDDAE